MEREITMATITEDYVSFKVAKLLKEKGFNELCQTYYDKNNVLCYIRDPDLTGIINSYSCVINKLACPTLQMAMKWLREIHNLDIITLPQFDNSKWTYSAIIFKLSIPCTEIRFNDNKYKKEQAYESAIKYCLENLI